MVALAILSLIVLCLTLDVVLLRLRARRVPAPVIRVSAPAPSFAMRPVPGGVFLHPSHTWALIEPSGQVVVGADHLPATLLGEVDAVALAPVGTAVRRGEVMATLRRAGRDLPLCAPVDGVIAGVNDELAASPAALESDPFGRGWLYRLEPHRLGRALADLHVGAEAAGWLRRELSRARDVLLAALAHDAGGLGATMADGGAPLAGVATHLDEATWNELVIELFGSKP